MAEHERSEFLMGTYRAQVDLSFPVGSGGGTNTWHFRTDQPIGIEDEVDTIMGWVKAFYTACAPLYRNSLVASWDGQFSEILTDAPTFQGPRTGWSVPGTSTDGGFGPAAGMACVTWRTEAATRSGRGRTFLGPLAPNAVELNGTLAPNALAAVRNAAAGLVTQSNTNDGVGALGVFSPTQNLFRDIVAGTVTDQVAILRSRRG